MLSVNLNSRLVFWISVISIFSVFFCLFSDISFPFLVGFILAYFCVPRIDYLSSKINRALLSMFLTLIVVLIFVIAAIEVLPRVKEYLILLSSRIPEYCEKFISYMNDTMYFVNIDQSDIHNFKHEMQKYLNKRMYIFASIVGKIASKGEQIRNFLSFFIVMPISFFYFLRDWNQMIKYIHNCIPQRNRDTFIMISKIIRKTLSNFLHGQFYVVTTLSAYYLIALWLMGVEHYAVLGIISGMFSFIPLIGALFSFVLVIFLSAPIMLTATKLYVIMLIYFIGQFAEGYILYPKFVGKKTGLHPLWILFSFFAGIKLQGIIGVLISIPSAAVIRSLIGFAMEKFKTTQSYKQ